MKRPFSSLMVIGAFNAIFVVVMLSLNVPRAVVVGYLVFNAWQIAANVITEIANAIRDKQNGN